MVARHVELDNVSATMFLSGQEEFGIVSDVRNRDGQTSARFFVFMGVCGVGKSTVARAAAEALDGSFVEADDLHSAENVKAMTEGRPLTDEERWPWLDAVCAAALAAPADGPVMIACSALALRYRDFIRARLPGAVFNHLQGPAETIRARMSERQSHFMSPAMLDSQLFVLEPPEGEPLCHRLDVDRPQEEVVAQAISICRRYLAATPQGAQPGAEPSKSKTA